MLGFSIETLLNNIGVEVTGQAKKYILEILSSRIEMKKLENKVKSRLVIEQKCLNFFEEEAAFDYQALADCIFNTCLSKNTLETILIKGENERASELNNIRSICEKNAKPENDFAKRKVYAIFNKCVRVIEAFFRDELSKKDMAVAGIISEEIIKHIDVVTKEQTDKLVKKFTDLYRENLSLNQTQITSDNKAFLDLYEQSLFLDKKNPEITLEKMFIPPLVRGGEFFAIDCITDWYQTSVPCMILYGEAGIGKTSLVSKMINETCKAYNCFDNPDK